MTRADITATGRVAGISTSTAKTASNKAFQTTMDWELRISAFLHGRRGSRKRRESSRKQKTRIYGSGTLNFSSWVSLVMSWSLGHGQSLLLGFFLGQRLPGLDELVRRGIMMQVRAGKEMSREGRPLNTFRAVDESQNGSALERMSSAWDVNGTSFEATANM